jgi:hypothetical protein
VPQPAFPVTNPFRNERLGSTDHFLERGDSEEADEEHRGDGRRVGFSCALKSSSVTTWRRAIRPSAKAIVLYGGGKLPLGPPESGPSGRSAAAAAWPHSRARRCAGWAEPLLGRRLRRRHACRGPPFSRAVCLIDACSKESRAILVDFSISGGHRPFSRQERNRAELVSDNGPEFTSRALFE